MNPKNNNGNINIGNRVALKLKLVRFAKKQEIIRAFTEIKRRKGSFRIGESNVYINDFLCSDTKEILQKSKRLLAEKKIYASWIYRGQVYVRTDPDLKQRTLISRLNDLDERTMPREINGKADDSSLDCLIEN